MLNKIKELVGVDLAKEIRLAQATLENGAVIESENFNEGSEVFIVTEEEKVALPIGEYKLEDGETLLVEEEGIIKSIGKVEEKAKEEKETEEVEVEAEEKEEKEVEMNYATKEELAELKSMIEEVKSMIEKGKEDKKEDKKEEKKEDLSKVEKIKHNPEGKEELKLNLFSQNKQSTTVDRVFNKISQIKK